MTELFNDSAFSSLSHGFGQLGSDRTADYQVTQKFYQQRELDLLTECNNFAANIVELLPIAMGKKACVFECENEIIKGQIQTRLNEITPKFVKATKLARQCGGSGLFLGNSDEDLSQPLITPIEFYNIFQGGKSGTLQIAEIEKNPLNPNFENPCYYKIRNGSAVIHASRIIPFYGIRMITKEQQIRYNHWGISVLHRSIDKLKNLDIADQSIANTISQFSRLIYEIEDLPTLLSSEQGKQLLRDRLALLNHSWNVLKTLVVKTGEKVYNLKVDYTGLDSMLQHFKEMLAGSADIPYQKLFNSGGGGEGMGGSSSASGSIDRTTERQWSDLISDRQAEDWQPGMTKLIDHWLRQPIPYRLEYPNLLQLSESEEIANDKLKAETEKIKSETQTGMV